VPLHSWLELIPTSYAVITRPRAAVDHLNCVRACADPLLSNPALFSGVPLAEQPWANAPATRGCLLLEQYLDLVDKYPTPARMVRAHMHKLLGDWLQVSSKNGA